MASVALTSRIDLRGPFFERDPARTIAENVEAMLHDVAREGEADVRQQLAAGESGRAPVRALGRNARVSQRIRGRVESVTGKAWHQHAVISADRRGLSVSQAIAVNAAASRLERTGHAFRRTGSGIRIARADLAKGLE